MALWEYLREKMRAHPKQVMCENGATMTYEELCIFAENYAKKLTADYYGIYCNSEMAAATLAKTRCAGFPPRRQLSGRCGQII